MSELGTVGGFVVLSGVGYYGFALLCCVVWGSSMVLCCAVLLWCKCCVLELAVCWLCWSSLVRLAIKRNESACGFGPLEGQRVAYIVVVVVATDH